MSATTPLSSVEYVDSIVTNNSETHDIEIFRTHILNSHASSNWTWQHSHDTRWRHLFYKHIIEQSYLVAPLTRDDAKAYESQLSASLPHEGFFPSPEIAAKSLACTRAHLRAHLPLAPHLQGTSNLCVPNERYATAQTHITQGHALGFYTGWIGPNTNGVHGYAFRLHNTHENQDVQGWDNTTTDEIRRHIFPLAHINERIWNTDTEHPNNLRSTALGGIYSREHIPKGTELTMGLGLYDFDWSHYKRTLLAQALSRLQILCELQQHTEYQHQVQALHDNLNELSHNEYLNIASLRGPLHAMSCLVEGEDIPPLFGSLLIHDMSLVSYIHQLNSVPEFTRVTTFRQAHHPDRRKPKYFDWPHFLTLARQQHHARTFPDPVLRRSTRLHTTPLPSPPRTPLYYELSPTRAALPNHVLWIPTLTASEPLPCHDALTTLNITKHQGAHTSHVGVTNRQTALQHQLCIHRYLTHTTVVQYDGTIHHPTEFVFMGDIIGEVSILDVPHTLLTWSALTNNGIEIHQNNRRLKLCLPDGTTLLRTQAGTPAYTSLNISTLITLQLPRKTSPRILPLHHPIKASRPPRMLDLTAPPHPIPHHTTSIPPPTATILELEPTIPDPDTDSDSCVSTDDSVDDIPEIEMITDYTIPLHTHSSNHVRMAWCNIAGCDDIQKIERIMALMRTHRLDFLCLTDARIISTQWGLALRAAAIQRLGTGSTVDIFVTTKGLPNSTNVGGQIIIKSPRIPTTTRTFCDPTGCAVVAGFDIHIGSTDIRIISTYWPGSTGSVQGTTGTLWDKVQTYLHKRNQHITPLEYIQTYILRKINEFNTSLNSLCIIGGDFNAVRSQAVSGTGIHAPLSKWCADNKLIHVFEKLNLPPQPTYYSGINPKHEIDHVLYTDTSTCQPTHGAILDDDAWAQETDHRPIVTDFYVPGMHLPHVQRWKRRRRRAKVVDISRTSPREISLFQAGMLKRHRAANPPEAMSPAELHRQLQRIHTDTYKVAAKISTSPRRKTGNWTPHMVALRCRQGALLTMARVTRGMSSPPHILHSQITTACRRWKRTLTTLSQTSDDAEDWEEYLGKGPNYWESLPPWETNARITQALRRNRNALNGRKATERRHRFLDSLQRRKDKRKAGKHLSELKTLLGGNPTGSMLDVLDEGGKRITEAHEIAQHTNDFFHEWHKKEAHRLRFSQSHT